MDERAERRVTGDVAGAGPGAPRGSVDAGVPAKVACPRAAGAITRPRLFELLDQLDAHPVTWIHAPAGAGKTTLLASYLRQRQRPVLWYEVDPGDADVGSVYHYARVAAESLACAPLSLPVPRPSTPRAQRVFARRFFEALLGQLPAGTCVVFDNYQEAASEPRWNELFRELCAALTGSVRVLVASRVAPPPELARFLAGDILRLLPGAELQLDPLEMAKVWERHGGGHRRLAGSGSRRLLELTSGWAVAVALLAKSHSAAEFGASGSPPAPADLGSVFDFLAGEVFSQLDASQREFLLEVALLPSFTASMATELTGKADAEQLIATLHHEHGLIERQGATGYRLHDLLRMFLLQRRASTVDPKARAERAARLLAANDQFSAAAALLTRARNWEALGGLIEEQAPVLAGQSRLALLGTALEEMPAAHRDVRPWLVYWRAVSALAAGRREAYELARGAFHSFRGEGDTAGTLLAWALTVQALAITANDLHPLTDWLKVLHELALTPPNPIIAVKVAGSELAIRAYHWTTASADVADAALELVGRHGSTDDWVLTSTFAGMVYLFAGRWDRAMYAQRVAQRIASASSDPLTRIVLFHFESVQALAHGQIRAAWEASTRGLELSRERGIDLWDRHLLGTGAMSAVGRHDFAAAERLLDVMVTEPSIAGDFTRGYGAYARGWLEFERGDIEAAVRHNDDSIETAHRIGFRSGRLFSLTSAVIYAAERGDPGDVEAAIAALDAELRGETSPFLNVQAELAKGYAGLLRGQAPSAALRKAFQEARQVGYGMFLAPRAIARLVRAALEYGFEVEHARALIASFELEPCAAVHGLTDWPWPVKVRVLGALEIEAGGRRVAFGRKPPAASLSLLALLSAASEPLSIENLSNALWPGYAGSAPRGTLDTALYRLRRLLGTEGSIVHEDGHVALDPDVCWTDTRAFFICCKRIGELTGDRSSVPDEAEVQNQERRLLDAYRGPLGKADSPAAVLRARAQLARRFVSAAGALQELWERIGCEERRAALAAVVAERSR